MPVSLDHAALLVRSIEATLERLEVPAASVGEIESFPSEGTRECYVGADGTAARLLLMQATGSSGPYASARERRGYGLHHLGFNVLDLAGFVRDLAGTGWYLLPQSLETLRTSRTAWVARPGVGTLLEVHERDVTLSSPLVGEVEVPMGDRPALFERLQVDGQLLSGVVPATDGRAWITLGGRRLDVRGLSS